MVYDFKIKRGFFKTESTKIHISNGKLEIIPKENSEFKKIVITDIDLISLSISKIDFELIHIEIDAENGNWSGHFKDSTKNDEIVCVLVNEFEEKIKFE